MGKLIIAGIGPGDRDSMTIAVDRALTAADIIIGYSVYVDLVRADYPGKEYFTTPMTKETDRCQIALDLALQGKNAVLICSGDSGIYGMAALVYELRGDSQIPEIEVLPGITAACSGGHSPDAPRSGNPAVIYRPAGRPTSRSPSSFSTRMAVTVIPASCKSSATLAPTEIML